MARHIRIPCPQCQYQQSLRTEFLGQRLCCVHCKHSFKVRVAISCSHCHGNLLVKLVHLGQHFTCRKCGHDFLAEVWLPCPQCQRQLKIRPEYTGHRVSCKECAQTFRVSLTEQRFQLLPVFRANVPQPATVSQTSAAADDSVQVFLSQNEDQTEGSPVSNRQEKQADAAADARGKELTPPQAGSVLEEEVKDVERQLKESSLLVQQLDSLRTELENARREREELHAEKENNQRRVTALEDRISELTSSLAQATAAQENARAGFLQSSEEQRHRAEADLQALRAEWEHRHQRDEELLRAAQALAEAERRTWQQQLDDLRTQSERQRQALASEAEEYREQAASLRKERDTALQQIDSLNAEEATVREGADGPARQVEENLRAETVTLKDALKAAEDENRLKAHRLQELSEQLRLQQIERDDKNRQLVNLEQELRAVQAELIHQSLQQVTAQRHADEENQRSKAEAKRLLEENVLLRQEQSRLTTVCAQVEQSRKDLDTQIRDLETKLDQQCHRAGVLEQELQSARNAAAAEQERLSGLLTEAQARVQNEKKNSQARLAAATQRFDQEGEALRRNVEKFEQEACALRRERTDLLGGLAAATEEGSQLALQCDELRAASRHNEECLQEKLRSLTQALQETQQHVQKLRMELEQQRLKEEQYQRDLAALEQERVDAHDQAAEAHEQLNVTRQTFEQERQALLKELEGARCAFAAAASSSPAAENAYPLISVEATRLGELALKVEALESEVDRQRAAWGKRRRLSHVLAALGGSVRGLLGSPPKDTAESTEEEAEPGPRLRALWTEVMSERERAMRQTTEAVRASLERQLADLRGQLQAATERADQLEAELRAVREPLRAEG